MKTKQLFLTLLCVMSIALVGNAKTIYVSYNGNNTNNGLSWATAVLSLDTAKVRASSGDNIWIQGDADGVNGYNSYNRSSSVAGQGNEAWIITDYNVYGGFKGNETSLDQRQLIDNDGNGIVEPWEFKYPTRIIFDLQNGARAFVCGGQTNTRFVDGIEFWMPNNYDFSTVSSEVQLFVVGPNTVFKRNTIRDAFIKTNNASLRPFVWNKGLMQYCLVQNNTVTGQFSGTTDIQFSPLLEILHQQKLTDVTPGIVGCVIRNNKTTADFSSSTLTSLAGRQRGFLIYINLNDPTKGNPSLIANNLIYNNECAYIKSSTSPATTNGGLFGMGFNNGTGSSVYIINNTIANNKASNLGASFMLVNEGLAYYANIINNIFWKNEKYLNGALVDPATYYATSKTPIYGNCFNNLSTCKTIYNDPVNPKRVAGNLQIETGANDKVLFLTPSSLVGVASDISTIQNSNWTLQAGSVLIGKGVVSNQNDTVTKAYTALPNDFSGRAFATPRTVGAFEAGTVNSVVFTGLNAPLISNVIFAQPYNGGVRITEAGLVQIYNIAGQTIKSSLVESGNTISLQKGIYIIRLNSDKGVLTQKIIL